MEEGLHEVFKALVWRTTKGGHVWVVCIVVVCFVIVKRIGVFVMETLCSHALIRYDLLASTIYSKKELQSFSFLCW